MEHVRTERSNTTNPTAKTTDTTTKIGRKWSKDFTVCAVHYAVAAILLVIYGMAVCPIMTSIDPRFVAFTFVIGFALAFAFRWLVWPRIAQMGIPESVNGRLFRADIALIAITGALICGYYDLTYHIPWHSSAKIIFGFAAIGFFIAVDLALWREGRLRDTLFQKGASLRLQKRFLPFREKFAVLAGASFLIAGIITLLVVLKDIQWLGHNLDQIETAKRAIIFEILFVSAVMAGYVIRIIRGFADRIGQTLNDSNAVLARVRDGDLTAALPVATLDEFGHSAELTNHMITRLANRTLELERMQEATLAVFMRIASLHDDETGGHIARTQNYVDLLTKRLMTTEKYANRRAARDRDLIRRAAPLHDIGKVGIPEAILRKPGRLTDDEYAVMQRHTMIGDDALGAAGKNAGCLEFIETARAIAVAHHEKWDGSGYPNGLKGEAIPLSARIMALADVYDALRSTRPYKPSFSHEKARGIILEGRGTHFDPDIVDAFLKEEECFIAIAQRHQEVLPAVAA